jgi:DNA adenine methylase
MQDSNATTSTAQPFLRWAGSKRQLIPTLQRYWDDQYSRYVEPFAGSASLFFSLSPSRALLGDINAELIATYEQVKKNIHPLLSALKTLKKGRKNYLALRSLDPSSLTPPMRAARFVYLNRYCFNGLYRTNRLGQFNVPYGDGKRSGKIPSDAMLIQGSMCLQRAQLLVGSFEKTLEKVRPGDFVYMDPPFKVKAKRVFNEYDASVFGVKELELLREWMIELDHCHIPFLISYAASEEAEFLRKGFHVEVVTTRRSVAGFASHREKVHEVLISNKPPRTGRDRK